MEETIENCSWHDNLRREMAQDNPLLAQRDIHTQSWDVFQIIAFERLNIDLS